VRALPAPLFKVDVATKGDTFVIRAAGELDLFERPHLDRALQEAETSRADRITLDLAELTFIDASGLFAVLAASRRSALDGNRLRITPGRGSVADMFHLTALDMTLPFEDDRASPTP
jgi:anti-sigma B factor antagonist